MRVCGPGAFLNALLRSVEHMQCLCVSLHQDDIVSFFFVSVPGVSVHFVSSSYRFLALAFHFVSFPEKTVRFGSGSCRSCCFPFLVLSVPFLFVSVVFHFFSFRFFPVPVLFGSYVFRFVSFRFLRFVSFPMSSCYINMTQMTHVCGARLPHRTPHLVVHMCCGMCRGMRAASADECNVCM